MVDTIKVNEHHYHTLIYQSKFLFQSGEKDCVWSANFVSAAVIFLFFKGMPVQSLTLQRRYSKNGQAQVPH